MKVSQVRETSISPGDSKPLVWRLAALLLGAVLTLPGAVRSSSLEPPSTGGLVALDRILARLETHQRLLVIGAHPDDEDSTLLALVARGLGGEAAYLSLSRGEGGQNLIGSELGVDLGLLRSQELVSARRIDGAQQFFTRAYDFGYTRSLEETFRFWPRQILLQDVVRVVRRFRPQVLVSVFPPTARAGHGQHQAAGVMALLAFERAADEERFEVLTKDGLPPWQPTLLYRSARFRPAATNLRLPVGGLDPLTGQSYRQIAMASRSRHRSQDMGMLQRLGPGESRVEWVAGGSGAGPLELFSGVDTRLAGMVSTFPDGVEKQALESLLEEVGGQVRGLRETLSPSRLGGAVAPLVKVLSGLREARDRVVGSKVLPAADRLIGQEFLTEKIVLAQRGVAIAAGIAVDATVEQEVVVGGDGLKVDVVLYNAGYEELRAAPILTSSQGWTVSSPRGETREVAPGELERWSFDVPLPHDLAVTTPYFLKRLLRGALYDWDSVPAQFRAQPFASPPLSARVRLELGEATLHLEREVVYRYRDQALGEIRRPVRAAPRVEVSVSPALLVWPVHQRQSRRLDVALTSHAAEPVQGRIEVSVPPGWPEVSAVPFSIDESRGSLIVSLGLEPPRELRTGRYRIEVAAVCEGERYDVALPVVDYEHIRPVASPKVARLEIQATDLRLPPLGAIGYIRGASDRVPEALAGIGVPVVLLSTRQLALEDADGLSRFDAVVVGSRAYETDPHLARANRRLLDYVRQGGLLIVQYQQYQFVEGQFAPFALEIGRPHDRVTDESAPVVLLDSEHPALRYPHRIMDHDWSDWVQERGLYFPRRWDAAYTPLLEMRDPGGTAQQGALLVAPLGEGTYVYTGLALFRQLPAGVPGAYRLFANLLALAVPEEPEGSSP